MVTISDNAAVEEDDSGMSAAGIVFLVLFLMIVVAGIVVGVFMYRKDKMCFKKNWEKLKNLNLLSNQQL